MKQEEGICVLYVGVERITVNNSKKGCGTDEIMSAFVGSMHFQTEDVYISLTS